MAAGRVDAYYELDLNPWDHAAGGLVAAEAGLVVTGLPGHPFAEPMALVAAPTVADAFVALLAELHADAAPPRLAGGGGARRGRRAAATCSAWPAAANSGPRTMSTCAVARVSG